MIITYTLVLFNVIDSTVAVLGGAALMVIVVRIFSRFSEMSMDLAGIKETSFIELQDVILLLLGMMIVVGVLSKTGFLEWIAVQAYYYAKYRAPRLIFYLLLITAVLSAVLDNVTTVLLMLPVTFEICKVINLNPVPLLVGEALASNIGGTATIIGDPPNIIIGSMGGLTFLDFIYNVAPIVLLILFVYVLIFIKIFYRKGLAQATCSEELGLELKKKYKIKNWRLFKRSIMVFFVMIFLFITHEWIGLTIGEASIFGAILVLIIGKIEISEALKSVEWSTLIFFASLLTLVAGAEALGFIDAIADATLYISGGNFALTLIMLLWVCAFTSALIGAIPTAATLAPVVPLLASNGDANALYWAVCLGTCLGGASTPLGTAANMVVMGFSQRTKYPVKFKDFVKMGIPTMIITVNISMFYLLARYVWL